VSSRFAEADPEVEMVSSNGASTGQSAVAEVKCYNADRESHHRRKALQEEFRALLSR
jgi:hypothetical protein